MIKFAVEALGDAFTGDFDLLAQCFDMLDDFFRIEVMLHVFRHTLRPKIVLRFDDLHVQTLSQRSRRCRLLNFVFGRLGLLWLPGWWLLLEVLLLFAAFSGAAQKLFNIFCHWISQLLAASHSPFDREIAPRNDRAF